MLDRSPIAEVAKAFQSCCDLLGKPITPYECEHFGQFLSLVYGAKNRAFHHLDHALEVGETCSPAGKIAAYFHDVVYKQVDHALLPELNSLFGIFDPKATLEVTIPSESRLANDPWALALIAIFEFAPAQVITPRSGMNEFLSAWVAIQKLSCILSREHILHIIACIEATLPFRGDQTNPTVSEKLKSKVETAAKILRLELSDETLDFIIKDSVRISNNDIQGFTHAAEAFLFDSWALLYESTPALQGEFHSIGDYCTAISKQVIFLGGLRPNQLFMRYQDVPAPEDLETAFAQAAQNLKMGHDYLQAKLMDAAILKAFAEISGGDCPLNLFSELRAHVENHLKHRMPKLNPQKKDERLRGLLANERIFKNNFALETNLFGTFVYDRLSVTELELANARVIQYLGGASTAEVFLASFSWDLITTLGEILSSMAWTRAPAIQCFLNTKKSSAA